MAAYTLQSFSKCIFNPMEKDLYKVYPELTALRPDCEQADRVLRYILFMYDPKSPLVNDFKNTAQRKQEAARLAGFNLEQDTDFLDDLYTFANREAVDSTCLFLRGYVNNMLWDTIVVHEQMYYEYHARLMASIEDEKTKAPKKSRKKIDEILGDLDESEDTTAAVNQKDVYATVVLKEKLREGLIAIYKDLQIFKKEMYPDDNLREAVKGSKITPETMSLV